MRRANTADPTERKRVIQHSVKKEADVRLLRYAEFSQRRWLNQLLDLHGRTL
jgi:hypothetical protein